MINDDGSELDLRFHIVGYRNFHAKVEAVTATNELASRIKSRKLIVRDGDGKEFVPTQKEIEVAIALSRCVVEPRISDLDWFKALAEHPLPYEVYARVLVVNGEITDELLESALDEARGTLEQNPLSETGQSSA